MTGHAQTNAFNAKGEITWLERDGFRFGISSIGEVIGALGW